MNLNNYTIKAQEAIQKAVEIAGSFQQQAVETGHISKALLLTDENVMSFLSKKLNVNRLNLDTQLDEVIESYPRASGQQPYMGNDANKALQKAHTYLKEFNDEFGHQSGDHCLQEVAQVLSDVTNRPEDIVCLYGGEEFAVIMANTPKKGAVTVANRLRQKLEDKNITTASGLEYSYLSVSVGVHSTTPTATSSAVSIIKAADDALYKAKNEGRNCVVCNDES